MAKDKQVSETSGELRAHDRPIPSAFAQFMSEGWAPSSQKLPALEAIAEHTARRRAKLAEKFAGDTLVVPTGNLKTRSNDTDYSFRPDSDFYYLTGCTEPDAILIIKGTQATLYLSGRSDRSTAAFYRDARYGELWVGPRRGVAETQAALGIECRDIAQLASVLEALDARKTRVLRGVDASVDAAVSQTDAARDEELARFSSDLRLIKDEYEIAVLQRAVDATLEGFEQCARELATAETMERGERWLEGTFWRQARAKGNDVGYGSIVACGHHATFLHWMKNDGAVRSGELALMDMGVESNEFYTADVTRTLPIGGRFSPKQREVYDAVLRAHQAAMQTVKPGVRFFDPHDAAMKVLAEQLEAWGMLPVSAAEALDKNSGVYRRFTLHSVSHMLGLDVHDCPNASRELAYDGELRPGMVLTIEPGLYFQPDDETVPEEWRGIGVRIEDDVLVTEDGFRNLSAALPVEADAVEAWMRGLTHP